MDNKSLLDQFKEWSRNGESKKIIVAAVSLPDEVLNIEAKYLVAKAYMDIDNPKQAIAVMSTMPDKEKENTFNWPYRMSLALTAYAELDNDCAPDENLRQECLEKAKQLITSVMDKDPVPPIRPLIQAAYRRILKNLGEEYDDEDDEDESEYLEMYDEDEMDVLEEHITDYFGKFPTVYHELVSSDIHVDIAVIPPTKKHNYFTLVTIGMGAREMNVTDRDGEKETESEDKARAELLICLPPDWKVGETSDEWFWPVALLKNLAHLPIECDTWLGWGHTVDNRNTFSKNTRMCASMLIYPEDVDDEARQCTLPSGDVVNFFEVVPLYEEEMFYKLDYGGINLLKRLQNVTGHVLDINRPNSCKYYANDVTPYDSARNHAWKICDKSLPLDPINGCNHVAIFIRWCIERNLMSRQFYIKFKEITDAVKNGAMTDIRQFVLDRLGGRTEMFLFSFLGAGLLNIYYNSESEWMYSYTADVDDYANSFFGDEKYNSEEFKDEAYLFVPFDEQYYQGMSKYIQRAYDEFYAQLIVYQKAADAETLDALKARLGITGQVIYPDTELARKLKSGAANKETLPMIIFDRQLCRNTKDAEEALYNSLYPLANTYILAGFPDNDPGAWLEQYFKETDEHSDNHEPYDEIFELYGQYPSLLTYDENPTGTISLFMRDKNGSIVRYVSKNC